MTALKISIEKGRIAANKYALGVSLLVIPQVYIAVFLTKFIAQNPSILDNLEKAGILIFSLLSYYFYSASKKGKINVEVDQNKRHNSFLTGIILSILNVFAIPFFSGIAILLDSFNLFNFDTIPILFFIFGSAFGSYYILFFYGKFAKPIQQKTGKITKNINLFLAILTGFVAVFTLIKLFF
jgi:threonine/homoserine/homoserine lactone efflux protein